MSKFAIKIPIGEFGQDDWLFVTKDGPDGIEIVLYDTREEAVEQAKKWAGRGVVVEYEDLN